MLTLRKTLGMETSGGGPLGTQNKKRGISLSGAPPHREDELGRW